MSNLPPWRTLDEYTRILAHQLATLSNENGKPYRFTVNLDDETKALAFKAAKGAVSYTGNRITDELRRIEKQLGRTLPWWGCVEFSPTDVMHVHGGLIANDNELPMIKDALRRATGECSTDTGADRWFVHLDGYDPSRHYDGFFGPLGWAAYALKDARKNEKRLSRSPAITSQALNQIAKEIWERETWEHMHVTLRRWQQDERAVKKVADTTGPLVHRLADLSAG